MYGILFFSIRFTGHWLGFWQNFRFLEISLIYILISAFEKMIQAIAVSPLQ